MKTIVTYCLSFLIGLLAVACGGTSSENQFPKGLPVDKKAQKEQAEQAQNQALKSVVKAAMEYKAAIEAAMEEGEMSFYTAQDAENMEFILETVTYYADEEKTMPKKTKLITMAESPSIYWLEDGLAVVDNNDYSYLFKGEELLASLRGEQTVEVDAEEQAAALKFLQFGLQLTQATKTEAVEATES